MGESDPLYQSKLHTWEDEQGPHPSRTAPTTRAVRFSEELAAQMFTRDADGNRLSIEWGEPDADGFYTPAISVDFTDNIATEARAEGAAAGWSVTETHEEDGSWSIVSDALPGLVVCHDSREQAWESWPEVVELWASTANEERVKAERAILAADEGSGA